MPVLADAGWARIDIGVSDAPSCGAPKCTYYVNSAAKRAQTAPPHFDILGLSEDTFRATTREQVFRAYREQLGRFGSDADDAALLKEAYVVLADTNTRSRYEQGEKMVELGSIRVALSDLELFIKIITNITTAVSSPDQEVDQPIKSSE